MTLLKALLVDLDGTLVDTREANFAAYQSALAGAGVTITRQWWTANGFGRSWRQFLPALLADHPGVDPQAIAAAKAEIYPRFLHLSRINGGLVRLLETLRLNLKTALVTTASRTGVDAVLDTHGLRQLFDEIITGDDVAEHKPSPEAFVEAARRLRVSASECLVIEDSRMGIDAGLAFGAPVLAVSEGGAQ